MDVTLDGDDNFQTCVSRGQEIAYKADGVLPHRFFLAGNLDILSQFFWVCAGF